MNEATEAAETPSPHLRRARVACKACNARRVKCDAADGQPCWHCRTRRTPCELIESKRGKYARKRQRLSQDNSASGDASTNQSAQPLRQDSAPSDRVRDGPQRCHGSNADKSPVRETQIEGLDTLSAGTDDLQAVVETQDDQSRQIARPHNTAKGHRVSYIVEVVYKADDGVTESLKVHYSIPASIVERPVSNRRRRVGEPVSLAEALIMPVGEVAHELIRAFFEVIHPAFPVLDRKEFTRRYLCDEASPLVLQTIYMLGLTVGSESLVQAAGYNDRTTARRTHYLRAKALYDADYESDPILVVACLLLLGFWWAGHDEQKDTCYWVGLSVIVAQSLKFHRSKSRSVKSPREKSLQKRIWWSIYVRDRHTAAAFGQPCRIRDEDCDIEPLTPEDFTIDDDYDQSLIPPQQDFHVSYAIEMSKLAIILGNILAKEFSPRSPEPEKLDTDALLDRLSQWESRLPDELRKGPLSGSLDAPFWASMLHFSYQSIELLSSADAERDVRVRSAADAITRMAEDLLSTGAIKFAQIHLVPSLFGALSVHTIAICRRNHVRQQLAENKARQCLLALSELAKSWPVKIWIAEAFVDLMERLTGQVSSSGGTIVSVSTRTTASNSCSHHLPPQRAATPQTAAAAGNPTTVASAPVVEEMDHQPGIDAPGGAMPQAAGAVVFGDPFWGGGYADNNNTFDIDFLLHTSLEPVLAAPFGGEDGADSAANTLGL